jgi:DNA-binding NarL/FixJ family response regulator
MARRLVRRSAGGGRSIPAAAASQIVLNVAAPRADDSSVPAHRRRRLEGTVMSTVLVCDDSALARETARRNVAAVPGVARVVTASSGEEGLARWNSERPDLTLMDVRMPGLGGIEAARRLLAANPDANVIMMTVAEDVDGVARAVTAGARGYLVKDASREELAVAITHALSGGAPLTRERPLDGVAGAVPALTEREMQVLNGMSRGRSNAEIGRELYLSEDTVKTHARRLFRKLGAADRAQAVALGFRWGLVR